VTDQPQASPLVSSDISEYFYRQICQILKTDQDFELEGYKDLCIKRRIAARIRAVGFDDPQPYVVLLQESPVEQEQLLEALTIHVSQFFRNPTTFALLEKKILPGLLQNSRNNRSKLRIWSAGCAGGEEPYSLALICQGLLRDKDLLSIVASDISVNILQRAKQACFAKNRLAAVPAAFLLRYFICQGKNYQLSSEIQKRVRFFRHNILTEQPNFRVDLILCRNLLIYFSRPQQARVIRILAKALQPGGYLVLGRAETLMTAGRELFHCIDPAERIYQRRDSANP
jgi:chemotaxis protein methyltransferase CheR